jgi:hypothetical protein
VAIAGAAAVDISVVWNTTYGEPGANDSAYSIVQASGDRGYLFAGETGSFGAGETDAWLVNRTGSGDERWNRTYGGPEKDTARALINTSDGNLLFAGTLTYVTEENRKDTDAWVMKLTPLGEVLWNETFGGPDVNISAFAAAGTSDGGYIIAGETAMWGEPDTDALVIKLNSSGYEEWTRTFGEPGRNDSAYAVVETGSGEIGVAGSTESFESFGTDAFILKINSSGNELWNVTFGGPENDTARSIVLAPDGDFVFAGSYMSRTTPNTTEDDALVVKMDPDGEVVWNWTYGNPDENESAETIIATLDSGYLFAGRSGNLSLDNNAEAAESLPRAVSHPDTETETRTKDRVHRRYRLERYQRKRHSGQRREGDTRSQRHASRCAAADGRQQNNNFQGVLLQRSQTRRLLRQVQPPAGLRIHHKGCRPER